MSKCAFVVSILLSLTANLQQDDGKPDQYDLPPPEPASVAAKANAPTAGDAVAGVLPSEDQDEWHKVGWAPRFGSGETEEEKGDERNLLDHQTHLEGKLDEKFFGGVYNIAHTQSSKC